MDDNKTDTLCFPVKVYRGRELIWEDTLPTLKHVSRFVHFNASDYYREMYKVRIYSKFVGQSPTLLYTFYMFNLPSHMEFVKQFKEVG